MRVLLLTDFFAPIRGGLEHHVANLAIALSNLGHTVAVATLTENVTPVDERVPVYTVPTAAARVVRYEDEARPFHPPAPDPLAHRALRRLIESFRPEVIHGHSWLAVSLPRAEMNRLVFSLHDYAVFCHRSTLLYRGTTMCGGPTLRRCVSCTSGGRATARSTVLATSTRVGRDRLRAREYIAVSRRVAELVAPFVDRPVSVVSNFVDPAIVSKPVPAVEDRRYVMYAGDPGAHKGMSQLLDMWTGPNPPAMPLLIASTRPLELELPQNVTLITATPGEARQALANAAIAVIPSRWEDPCPTVALEALALGTPVVAYRRGGLPEIVTENETGHLIAADDVRGMRTTIDWLISDATERARLSEHSLKRAEQFTSASIVPRIVDVYERAVRSADRRPAPTDGVLA